MVALFPFAVIGGGLLAATSGGGAVLGAVAGHAAAGMSRKDLKELGEYHDEGQAGLLVVGVSDMGAKIEASMKKALPLLTRAPTGGPASRFGRSRRAVLLERSPLAGHPCGVESPDVSGQGDTPVGSDEKRMKLRYAGVCRECGLRLPAGTTAIYDRASRTVRCTECPAEVSTGAASVAEASDAVDIGHVHGSAGASARRESQHRRAAREERVRANHPRLGGLLLALFDDPQSTKAWTTGADGEERLGTRLDAQAGPLLRVLHDLRIPGSRTNIDHVVVCPSGVVVIDAKKYRGRPQLRVEGGILRPREERLVVGGRDRSRIVDGVLGQRELVRASLGDGNELPAKAVLCFVGADWPLIGGDFETRGVHVLWPRKLISVLAEPGPLTESDIARTHQLLASLFPTA